MFSFMRSAIILAFRMPTLQRSSEGQDGEALFTQGGDGQDPAAARRAGREDSERAAFCRRRQGLDRTLGKAARARSRGSPGALSAVALVHDLCAAAVNDDGWHKTPAAFGGGRLAG